VKSFFGADQALSSPVAETPAVSPEQRPRYGSARIAVYDAPSAAPRVEEIGAAGARQYIEDLSSRIYSLARECGGAVPYTVIREVAENFIHADFAEPVVSIMDGGATIRFADQGPGIRDAERAALPGFTTATSEMKRYIRGVGSGLPIVKEFLSVSGGSLRVEDNLGCGAVVTISLAHSAPTADSRPPQAAPQESSSPSHTQHPLPGQDAPRVRLSTRQKHVLALVMENGAVGPSMVAADLGVGVSTAYRDLASLEEEGLITAVDGGKRRLSPAGRLYLESLTS
jgi:hypothetical protein